MKQVTRISLIFLPVLCVLAAAYWLLGTGQGLQFLLDRAARQLSQPPAQSLDIRLQEGRLWDGMRFSYVRWRQDDQQVEASNVKLHLDFSQLLRGVVVIRELSADSVRVDPGEQKADQEPLVLPEEIRLPVDLYLKQLRIARLSVAQSELHSIEGSASVSNMQLQLHQLNARYQGIGLASAANMVLTKPYRLAGAVKLAGTLDALQVKAGLDIAGSLERLQLLLEAKGHPSTNARQQQHIEAKAVLLPFSVALVEQLDLSAQAFNPALWLEGAPQASLDIRAMLQPDQHFTTVQGHVSVANTAPGALQAGRVPVAKARADVLLTLNQQQLEQAQLQMKELTLSDGKKQAGQAEGQWVWKALAATTGQAEPPGWMNGQSSFSVKGRGLNAGVFVALNRPTAIDLSTSGFQQGDRIQLNQLSLKDRQAEVSGSLQISLQETHRSKIDLQFAHVNPADYLPRANPLFQGDLNGMLKFDGELTAPSLPRGMVEVNLDNSRLAKAPFRLLLNAQGSREKLEKLVLDLDVAGNTAKASGAYGSSSDFIDFQASFDQLKNLGQLMNLRLDGMASARGRLQVLNGHFSGQASVNGRQLKLDQLIDIEAVHGRVALGSSSDSPWEGEIQMGRVRQPGASGHLLNSLNLQLSGVRRQHLLNARFTSGLTPFSRSRPLQGELQLQGGMLDAVGNKPALPGWKGALSQLKVEGLWLPARSLELQRPAALQLRSGQFELLNVEIKGEDGSLLQNRVFKMAGPHIEVEGEMPRFSIPRLSPLLRRPISIEPKDLVAKADWRYLASPGQVQGHVNMTHLSGGLQVLEDSQIDVNIRQMNAALDFNRSGASLDMNLEADQFGRLTANLFLPVAQNADTKVWRLDADKPMRGAVAAAFTQLNWLGPMVSEGVRTSGSGQVAVALGGSLSKPDVQGRLFAMNVDLFQLDQGVRLEEGNVVVDFTLDHATIDTFEFSVFHRIPPRQRIEELGPLIQGKGRISARGRWNLTGLNGDIQVSLDRVPLLQRPDRWLMVNSSVSIQQPNAEGQPLRIRGDVKALGAYVEMPEKGPETLSDDVVVRGRNEAASAGLPLDFQLQASLGDQFYLNAAGLKSRLTGGLRLVMLEGVGGSGQRRSGRRLTANGTIQTADGTYRAYGQDLTIERGVVNFQGPLDNPGLNIRAVRKGVAVEAGVEVTGTAQRPKVTLVSDPAVPDSEKLSWMIIGRGSNSADRDSRLLLTAAAAIFGNEDESTTRKIAKSVGIDDLNFSTGSLTAADTRAVGSKVAVAPGADASASIIGSDDPLLSQRIISLGKRISDQVYLSFDQSVTTAASILKINYQYSRQLSLIARAGADNAVDVLYQLSFD